ncbi:MAG TPA: hypothetical protein PK157_18145 [Bryobacteraceae bacterium]|nr:hypothetical protein [Bryobacteraceae bacterium]
MPVELPLLVKEIHRQARLQGMAPPGATRLVKLLYLADLEWRRQHGGAPLAQLTWRFLHFGPYACELADLLGGPEVEKTEFETGKVAHRLVFAPEELENPQVPEEICGLLARLLKSWGDADLNMLLDFVYFETEPMERARRGELLDFSQLRQPARAAPPRVDQQRLKALRARLAERVRDLKLRTGGLQSPLIAHDGARVWDEEDRPVKLPIGAPIEFPGV